MGILSLAARIESCSELLFWFAVQPLWRPRLTLTMAPMAMAMATVDLAMLAMLAMLDTMDTLDTDMATMG